jgi:hypothetical protein
MTSRHYAARCWPAFLLVAVLTSCENRSDVSSPVSDSAPEVVYVRTPDVKVHVQVAAPTEASVDEWITLSASREISGEWKKVKFTEVGEETAWLGVPVNGLEKEVAGNLTWFTDPPQPREFDVPGQTSHPSFMQRKVKFKAPGTYKLWATSYHPIDGTSNVIVITVK